MSIKQKSPVYIWDFCINEEYATLEQLKELMPQIAKSYVFQLEQGEENDKRHWQGRMSLYKKARNSQVLDMFSAAGMQAPNYCEPTHETQSQSFSYVIKAQTCLLGPFRDGEEERFIPWQYRMDPAKFYPYQKVVFDSYDVFDDQTINFVYSPKGNIGKSTICGYIDLSGMGYLVPPVSNYKKLHRYIFHTLYEKNINEPKMFLLDIPRSMRQSIKMTGLYSALESIKKGVVYEFGKHARKFLFNTPQVWVFSTEKPYLKALTRNLWKVWTVNDKMELEAVAVESVAGH